MVLLTAAILSGTAASEDPPPAAVPCLRCHGPAHLAEKPRVPSILGQDAKYLIHQIAAFQREYVPRGSGFTRLERKHPVMNAQAPKVDHKDVGIVAGYFSRQACVNARDLDGGPSVPPPKPLLATRCFLCHGAAGHSRHTFIPTLAGQRQGYLRTQLLSFRDTHWIDLTRPGQSRVHSMMTRQGAYLTDAQIDDLAAYFAAQPCR
ncbi:MAG: c-type cytochrome [Alphaproteobacteria bacterium]